MVRPASSRYTNSAPLPTRSAPEYEAASARSVRCSAPYQSSSSILAIHSPEATDEASERASPKIVSAGKRSAVTSRPSEAVGSVSPNPSPWRARTNSVLGWS